MTAGYRRKKLGGSFVVESYESLLLTLLRKSKTNVTKMNEDCKLKGLERRKIIFAGFGGMAIRVYGGLEVKVTLYIHTTP